MKDCIQKIIKNERLVEIVLYVFFGGLTTVVNFVVYFLARDFFNFNFVISNTISWISAVLFAFITNKIWVFKSKTENLYELTIEFGKFVFYRLLSFGIDMGSMFIFIKALHLSDFISKLLTQIFIVVSNYVFSKIFIFKSKEVKVDKY